MQIVRYQTPSGSIQTGIMTGNQISGSFTMTLHELLSLSANELRNSIEQTMARSVDSQPVADLQAPIDGLTEVWAAGVTYKRSVDARVEESETPDIYTRVYTASRPELFFKGVAHRIAGPDAAISIRA